MCREYGRPTFAMKITLNLQLVAVAIFAADRSLTIVRMPFAIQKLGTKEKLWHNSYEYQFSRWGYIK